MLFYKLSSKIYCGFNKNLDIIKTACAMKIIPLVNTLLINTIDLSHNTHVHIWENHFKESHGSITCLEKKLNRQFHLAISIYESSEKLEWKPQLCITLTITTRFDILDDVFLTNWGELKTADLAVSSIC